MKGRKIITLALFVFIAVSIVYVIMKENKPVKQEKIRTDIAPGTNSKVIKQVQNNDEMNYVVVYYFHGNMRCRTCMAFEEYTQKAIDDFFPGKVKEGKLRYKIINVEESGNEHFIRDYNLVTKSVVIAEIVNGKEVKWKNLDKIWSFVSDKQKFISYIKSEIASMSI